MTAPQDVHAMIPGPVNVTLYGKRDFVVVIQLSLLRWEDYPGLSEWAQCRHRVPITRRQEGQSQTRWDNRSKSQRFEDAKSPVLEVKGS